MPKNVNLSRALVFIDFRHDRNFNDTALRVMTCARMML